MSSREVRNSWVSVMDVTLLISFAVAIIFMGGSSVLNGCAVFANKHALAQAHACEGGKRTGGIPFPKGGRGPVCTSAARKIKVPLARARSGAP